MTWRAGVLLMLAVAASVAAALMPRWPQNPAYHAFADQRLLLGVPHFWNVVSNAAFTGAGLFGLVLWGGADWRSRPGRWGWLVVGAGAALTGIGSAYYHVAPDNQTLYWDRLPMAVLFMGIFSTAIGERISGRAGSLLLAPLLLLGAGSVEVWRRGELAGVGAGDLRLYGLVQYYPMIALALMLLFYQARYGGGWRWWTMLALYAGAKVAELCDAPVYGVTGGLLSGHVLKHVLGGAALVVLFGRLRSSRQNRTAALSAPAG
ncbi:MAG: alkaline phytoceramidase [Candidatus Solibacter usitatus]|nr:alkaline phytoceramidase [Candidatus Solibacter usitatus]